MSDVQFATFIRPYLPDRRRKPSVPNLFRSIMAGLDRVQQAIGRWRGSRSPIPWEFRLRIQTRMKDLASEAGQLRSMRRRSL